MKDPAICKHYWQVQGEPKHRWFDAHAIAKCVHCYSRTTVEYGMGVGPCEHAVGHHTAAPHQPEKPARPPLDDGYMDCLDCQLIIDQTPFREEIKQCPKHNAKTPS